MRPKRALLFWMNARQRELEAAAARVMQQASARRQRMQKRVMQAVCLAVATQEQRRHVERADGGWKASTLYGYLERGDEVVYKQKFRVTMRTFDFIVEKLTRNGHVKDSNCRNPELRVTARFKVAVAMYYLAHGCCESNMVGDVASLGAATVDLYLTDFCEGVLCSLRPLYMPASPPRAAHRDRIKAEFAKRRGISCVAMAVDGTHVPFRGGPDYKNYKGWTSILALAYVNSFYLFVDADVGAAGRAGDNTILKDSFLLRRIQLSPDEWLGPGGVIAADGGASDGGKILLNPIQDAREPDEVWYNFCHSSTRFFVEETFGRWKNRFRFLLRETHMSHKNATRLIYVSMILHNLCTIRKDDAVDFKDGTDAEWLEFFETYASMSCPSCTRKGALHCPHVQKWKDSGDSIPLSNNAAARRDAIKDHMWEELCNDDTMHEERANMERRAVLGHGTRWAA